MLLARTYPVKQARRAKVPAVPSTLSLMIEVMQVVHQSAAQVPEYEPEYRQQNLFRGRIHHSTS
jgi:hypothetical protein